MENRKIKVKSLISVTAWAVALGMFIAYLFLKRQWMLFTIDFAILLCCLLGISDPEEDRRSKNVYWILLITRVMDITIRCVYGRALGALTPLFERRDTVYLHLGQNEIVPDHRIIGIFDLDKCSYEKRTREYLTRAEKDGVVLDVSGDLPKSFVVCDHPYHPQIVYLSQLNTSTLKNRAESGKLVL